MDGKELIKHIDSGDVLRSSVSVASWSEYECEPAEVPEGRLGSEWYPRVPWPRYSRKLTFRYSRPRPLILDSGPRSRACERK